MDNFTNKLVARIPILSIFLSGVVAWLLLPLSDGFPMVAFFILFTCLGTLVYLLRKQPSWFDNMLYLGILCLSFFLIFRANEAVQLISFLFIILLGSLLVLPLSSKETLPVLLLKPVLLFKEALLGTNHYPYSWKFVAKLKKAETAKLLASLFITFLFLAITLPLLSSANPFFNRLVGSVLDFLNLSGFLSSFNDQVIFNTFRLGFFILFAFGIPRVLTASTKVITEQELNLSLPINYLLPKVVMGGVLVVFFITQAQLYFASPEFLQSLGYTNSRLTNEVFFQVTIVAFIIFFLTYLDSERKRWNKGLTYFLILEAFFLVGIAFKSVFDYTFLWGLTEKRLWGYATMLWLAGALGMFLYFYIKQIPLLRFFRLIITYTIIILLGINLANFDYLITHFSKVRLPDGTDYVYMSKLSSDARFYKENLDMLVTQIESSSSNEYEKLDAAFRIIGKIDNLKRKYSQVQINSFNFSEYAEYRRVVDVDIEMYNKRLLLVDQRYREQEAEKAN